VYVIIAMNIAYEYLRLPDIFSRYADCNKDGTGRTVLHFITRAWLIKKPRKNAARRKEIDDKSKVQNAQPRKSIILGR